MTKSEGIGLLLLIIILNAGAYYLTNYLVSNPTFFPDLLKCRGFLIVVSSYLLTAGIGGHMLWLGPLLCMLKVKELGNLMFFSTMILQLAAGVVLTNYVDHLPH